MALARPKAAAIAEPVVDPTPRVRSWAGRVAGRELPLARRDLPLVGRSLPVVGRSLPMTRTTENDVPLRRCTFRRLAVTSGRGPTASYAAECLYEGIDQPLAMGDLDRARSICQGCTNPGIFRADED